MLVWLQRPCRYCSVLLSMGVGKGEKGGLAPPGFWKFRKRVVFLVSSGKNQISPFWPPPRKILEKSPSGPLGKCLYDARASVVVVTAPLLHAYYWFSHHVTCTFFCQGTCFVWSVSQCKTMDGIMQVNPRAKLKAHTRYALKCKFSPDSV